MIDKTDRNCLKTVMALMVPILFGAVLTVHYANNIFLWFGTVVGMIFMTLGSCFVWGD